MSHFNDLADQMGVGADDYDYTPELWDYDADPPDAAPMPDDERDDERDEAAAALDAVLVRLFVGGLAAYGLWLLILWLGVGR